MEAEKSLEEQIGDLLLKITKAQIAIVELRRQRRMIIELQNLSKSSGKTNSLPDRSDAQSVGLRQYSFNNK